MATSSTQPKSCPHCGSADGFTARGVRFVYDQRSEMGSLDVEQVTRGKAITLECNACHELVEVWVDAK